MAQMFLVTLSEANWSDIDSKKWLLYKVCNRIESLCNVTLTSMNSSWSDLSSLIYLLCQTYNASGGDFKGLQKLLKDRLEVEEKQFSEEQLKSAHEEWDNRSEQFWREMFDLEGERGEELETYPVSYFFNER